MTSAPDADRIGGGLEPVCAETAATEIGEAATIGVSGFGSVGYPKAVPLALADADRDLSLTVISGGSVGEEIDTSLVEADAIARRYPYQAREASRRAVNDGEIAFHDRHVWRVSDEVALGQLPSPDVAIVEAVAVGEGWLVPGLSIGATPALVEAADRLIVEVNERVPRTLERFHDVYRPVAPPNREAIPLTAPDERIGSPRIEFDPEALAAVVRTDRQGTPYSFREPTERDRRIGANLASFLEAEVARSEVFDEELRLQFGVGNIGNALMGALADLEVGDRDVVYFGEVVQDGLLDMLDEGIVSAASGTSLALSENGQEQLFSNVDRYADSVVLRPSDISNHPGVINRLGIVGVNSALEVDLYGHANSTHVNGSRMVNGIGGSGDFNRNALLAITALPSTAGGGDISRIVPMVTHADHTEHDFSVVVTEHGVADLRGRSPTERAEALISECAAPAFRNSLREYLGAGNGHMPHDLDRAFSWDEP
jgi:succinyl-CoA:acetate CoA-transferase